MKGNRLPWAVAGLLLAGAAQAAPLTCTQFRDRFGGALLASADKNAGMATFTLAFDNPIRGKRYDVGAPGLDGTLSCDAADRFNEFYLTLAFENKATFAATLSRFAAMAGASICTMASDGATACADAGKGMVQTALAQMGAAYKRGSRNPSGASERALVLGARAELTAAPTLLTFLIEPAGAGVDEARQPLAGPKAATDGGTKP